MVATEGKAGFCVKVAGPFLAGDIMLAFAGHIEPPSDLADASVASDWSHLVSEQTQRSSAPFKSTACACRLHTVLPFREQLQAMSKANVKKRPADAEAAALTAKKKIKTASVIL